MIEALMCLALNVYFEARSEPLIGQFAVAQVTVNRLHSNDYPDTMCGVVKQRNANGCQFSWYCDGKSDKPKDYVAWEVAQWVARVTLDDHDGSLNLMSSDVVHYHADYVKPYWINSCVAVGQYGRHIFYRRKI